MGTVATRLKQEQMVKEKRTWLLFLEVSLVPRPRPAFRHLQYSYKQWKAGQSLGTRLSCSGIIIHFTYSPFTLASPHMKAACVRPR